MDQTDKIGLTKGAVELKGFCARQNIAAVSIAVQVEARRAGAQVRTEGILARKRGTEAQLKPLWQLEHAGQVQDVTLIAPVDRSVALEPVVEVKPAAGKRIDPETARQRVGTE